MINYNDITPVGYFGGRQIYYNFETEKLMESDEKLNNNSNSLTVPLILISVPILKALEGILKIGSVSLRIGILLVSTVLIYFACQILNRNIYSNIKFKEIELSKIQFENFYKENLKNTRIVIGTVIITAFLAIASAYIYILDDSYTSLIIFELMFFVLVLLITNKIHLRGKIFNIMREKYYGKGNE